MISQHNGGNKGGGDVGGDARNDENDGPRADAGQGEDEAPKATGTNVLWGSAAGTPLPARGAGQPSHRRPGQSGRRGDRRHRRARGAFPGRDAPPARRGRGGVGFVSNGQDMQHIWRRQRAGTARRRRCDFVLSVERANAAFHSFLESLAA